MAIIGRDPFADIVLPHPQVNARHAFLEPRGAGCYHLLDLGSSNGTYLAGRRIASAEIHEGADLGFGGVPFDWERHRLTLQAEALLPPGLALGSDPNCDLVISDSRVSSRHLRVIPQEGGLLVLDLGSASGLFVNGRPASRALVAPEDRVRLGSLGLDLFRLLALRSAHRSARMVTAPRVVA